MLLNRYIYQTKHFIDFVHPMYNSGLIRMAFSESLFINRVDINNVDLSILTFDESSLVFIELVFARVAT